MKKGTLFLYLAALFTCIILFGWPILVIVDSALAASCGACAILYAVIYHEDYALYYNDHYNKNSYRTDKKTNDAQLAFDALLAKQQNRVFNQYALKSYSCSLPNCK